MEKEERAEGAAGGEARAERARGGRREAACVVEPVEGGWEK